MDIYCLAAMRVANDRAVGSPSSCTNRGQLQLRQLLSVLSLPFAPRAVFGQAPVPQRRVRQGRLPHGAGEIYLVRRYGTRCVREAARSVDDCARLSNMMLRI